MKPKVFFATFHTEHAYYISQQPNIKEFNFEGSPIELKQAAEPTDIIWENRHIRKSERNWRWCSILIVMALLTFGVFTIMVYLVKQKLIVQFIKDPPGVDCVVVTSSYKTDLMQMAYQESKMWTVVDNSSNKINQMTSRHGALKCFCDNKKSNGDKSDQLYQAKDRSG